MWQLFVWNCHSKTDSEVTNDAIVNTANPKPVIKGTLMSPKRLGIRSWQSLLGGHTKMLESCETEHADESR